MKTWNVMMKTWNGRGQPILNDYEDKILEMIRLHTEIIDKLMKRIELLEKDKNIFNSNNFVYESEKENEDLNDDIIDKEEREVERDGDEL